MSEHTEGLLKSGGNGLHVGMRCVATTHMEPKERRDADARRLAACWNACADIPTERLEEAVELGITDISSGNLFSARLALQKQLAKAIALLKDGADPDATQAKADIGMVAKWDVDALALIAEVEGKWTMSESRKDVLLRAAYDLLKNSNTNGYVTDALSEVIVHYDEADCDGTCLMEDIAIELEIYK